MTANTIEHLGNRIVTLRRSRAVAAISVVLLLLIYSSGLIRRHGLIDGFGHVIGADLLAQRVASQMTRDGQGDSLYDFDLQARYEQEAVSPETLPGLDPFVSPPYVALVYWPLMPLRHETAFAIWTALGVIFFITSMYWLSRDYPWVTTRLPTIALLSLSFFPVIEGLMAGSNQMLSLLIFTGMFLSLKHGNDAQAGVFLGTLLFKPQLAIASLVVLVFKRRWKALLGFGPVAAIWLLSSTLFVTSRSVSNYVEVIPDLTRLSFADGFPYYLQGSLYALFMIPLGPHLMKLSTTLATLASLAVLGLLLRMWAGPWKTQAGDFDVRFAATLIATTLTSQHFLLHDFTITILAAVLVASHWIHEPVRTGWGTMRLAFASLWVATLVGPILTLRLHVPVVPLAALFVGWSLWITAGPWTGRETTEIDVRSTQARLRRALSLGTFVVRKPLS
jgi:Glycosyltransferase family 87